MRALLPVPLTLATALPFKSFSDLCLFTSWEEPKEFDAGRFSADMLAVVRVWSS